MKNPYKLDETYEQYKKDSQKINIDNISLKKLLHQQVLLNNNVLCLIDEIRINHKNGMIVAFYCLGFGIQTWVYEEDFNKTWWLVLNKE